MEPVWTECTLSHYKNMYCRCLSDSPCLSIVRVQAKLCGDQNNDSFHASDRLLGLQRSCSTHQETFQTVTIFHL